ncbi:MAG: HAD family hydrolase [Elusimicrobia bacterium]|nr:HAD family hydrolase [Elusimicrobiota bacterium]
MILKSFQILPVSPVSEKEFLTLAASLETHSDHPIAKAILKVAKNNQCPLQPAQNFKNFPGCGVGGITQNKAILLGSMEFMRDNHLEIPDVFLKTAALWEKEGDIVVFCGWEGQVHGIFRLVAKHAQI